MPQFLGKAFEKQIFLTGNISADEAKKRWIENPLEKTVGKPFCEFRYCGGEKYIMFYHANYKKDFCDVMFAGNICGEETCELHGCIKSTPQMKLFAYIFLLCCLLLGALYLVYAPLGYPLYGFLIITALGFSTAFLTLRTDTVRTNKIIEALQEFINETRQC